MQKDNGGLVHQIYGHAGLDELSAFFQAVRLSWKRTLEKIYKNFIN